VLVAGEPSAEVIAALLSNDETKRAQGLEKITALPLINRDLRRADLSFTLFPKANLRGANLKGANLRRARIVAGDLSPPDSSSSASLPCGGIVQQKTSSPMFKGERCGGIVPAHFAQPAYICLTNLQGADLLGTQLQGADLREAQLQGANLQQAELQEAILVEAELPNRVRTSFTSVRN
jgi:uncharacterized protein YjbI with pentapeptide repeats